MRHVRVGGDAPQRIIGGVAPRRRPPPLMPRRFAISGTTLPRNLGPSTMPGATQLTLMLWTPTSRAKLLVMPRNPHFDAE